MIDVDKPLVDEEQVVLPYGSNGTVSFGKLAVQALDSLFPEDHNLSIDEKIKRARLGNRLKKGGQQSFSVDDLARLTAAFGRCFTPQIVLAAVQLLDPNRLKDLDEPAQP